MVPRKGIKLPDLTGKSVFIAAGTNDLICSPMESTELNFLLEGANAIDVKPSNVAATLSGLGELFSGILFIVGLFLPLTAVIITIIMSDAVVRFMALKDLQLVRVVSNITIS